jgi:hypothetical protein
VAAREELNPSSTHLAPALVCGEMRAALEAAAYAFHEGSIPATACAALPALPLPLLCTIEM